MRSMIAAILLLMTLAHPVYGAFKEDVKNGNALYNKEKYSEAAKLYENAARLKPESSTANFNLADALYKERSYEKAISSCNKAIASQEADIVQKADYNIGNAEYRLGNKEAALQFYKRAIDLDPGDRDAKFNYEFLQIKIYQMKNEDEKKDNKKDKKDQQKDQNKDKNKDQQNKDQNKDQQQNEQNKKDNDKDKQQKDQQGGGQDNKDQQNKNQ